MAWCGFLFTAAATLTTEPSSSGHPAAPFSPRGGLVSYSGAGRWRVLYGVPGSPAGGIAADAFEACSSLLGVARWCSCDNTSGYRDPCRDVRCPGHAQLAPASPTI